MRITASAPGNLVPSLRGVRAFVPNALPPSLRWSDELGVCLARAGAAVGIINGTGTRLPNPSLLFLPYLRREAVISSRLEGTISSISEVLFREAVPEESRADATQEVVNYVGAMEHGLASIERIPLCLNVVREMHRILLQGTRGRDRSPGHFRTEQNHIGTPGADRIEDATYVPPPPAELPSCLGDWERYLHAEELLPRLIQCALLHYQFEAIHPFLDGNGRVGRLVNTLFLVQHGVLTFPMLNLSEYFERDRAAYYEGLQAVTELGAWERWVMYFLRGVEMQANSAAGDCERLLNLRERLAELVRGGRPTTVRAIPHICAFPVVRTPRLSKELGVSVPAAQAAIDELVEHAVLTEVTGFRRNRIWRAQSVIDAIEGVPIPEGDAGSGA